MPVNNKTFNPILRLTFKATEDISPCRFIEYNGKMSLDNKRCLGVSEIGYINGEEMSLIVQGVAVVESSGAISVGQNVATSASGKARLAVGADIVVGRALDSSSSNDFIRVLLVQ